jgi:hypothetical protein
MRDVSERLRDIQEAITRIERYAVRGRAAFDQLLSAGPSAGTTSNEHSNTLSPSRAIGTPVAHAHVAQIGRAAQL